ncbi:MAG: hypothetical protein WAN03_19995 [Candidatus Sulfotelmatobacter sp.]
MSPTTIARAALLAVVLTTFAVGSDKTPHTYQKGTINGWEDRTDLWGSDFDGRGIPRNVTVFELNGADMVYLIDYCGAFQAGQFGLGQAVDYRLDADRLYIRRDNGKEYKCKIQGQKISQDAKTVAPSAKP